MPDGGLDDILRPGRTLTTDDVLTLSERLESPSRARQRRLDERDRLIRTAAAELFPDLVKKARARAMSRELDRHLAGFATDTPEAFERIAGLNNRQHLGAESIDKILRAVR
ncbi:MAG: hypothetical protein JO038_07230 [Alphaproteobacteria bacterium]|nr:hypothetical protein [Alphaproteobacteria bacterium]